MLGVLPLPAIPLVAEEVLVPAALALAVVRFPQSAAFPKVLRFIYSALSVKAESYPPANKANPDPAGAGLVP